VSYVGVVCCGWCGGNVRIFEGMNAQIFKSGECANFWEVNVRIFWNVSRKCANCLTGKKYHFLGG